MCPGLTRVKDIVATVDNKSETVYWTDTYVFEWSSWVVVNV